ncbi:hypothetical protein LCGC14_0602240 [marine sediment metagenome]|uniref:Uncharacterized protein n=1 Tax=marine sediment metagenome TaxID=412755 RepID=A0A0F9RAA0_9ZZZZ
MSRRLEDWITNWIEFQENTEPPLAFKEWTAISIVAAALQRKCYLDFGHLVVYPNMYIILIGPSGCRKGTAMTPGRDMLNSAGIKLSAESTTREALIRALKHSTKSTSNLLSGIVDSHASLTIYSQELTVFMGYNNVQLMTDMTDLFDCRDPWNYDTKDEALKDYINKTWLNMLGATTPETLHAALPSEAIGGGFTSRIVFVYATKKGKVVPIPYMTEDEKALRRTLESDLKEILMMDGVFKYDKGFISKYTDWRYYYEKNPPFKDFRLAGYMERKPVHLLKLCMIISASESNDKIITADTFDRVLTILERVERNMPNVYAGFGESRDASVLARVMTDIMLAAERGVTFEELISKYYYDIDSDNMHRILRTLGAMNEFDYQRAEGTAVVKMIYKGKPNESTKPKD